MNAPAILVLVALLVAGCTAPGERAPAPTETTQAVSAVMSVPINATACTRVFPAVFVDRAHAQSFLPAGFKAADSSQFFGRSGIPDGRAVLIVSMMRCASSDAAPAGYAEAMAGIFVEPPRIDGAPVKGEHFYELGRAFRDDGFGATLRGLGWSRIGEKVAVTYAGEPAHAAGGTVSDANGTVFAASVSAAPARDTFTGALHLHWWHQTPTGLGFFEYTFRPEGWLGMGGCTARAGSAIALVLRSTTCDSALFMVGPPFDVQGRLEHRPGVRPDA